MPDPKLEMRIHPTTGNAQNSLKTKNRLDELSDKIDSLKAEYAAKLSQIDSNKNHSTFLWIGAALVIANAVITPNFFGFFVVILFVAIYFAYKKLTDKESLKSAVTAEFEEKINSIQTEISRLEKDQP